MPSLTPRARILIYVILLFVAVLPLTTKSLFAQQVATATLTGRVLDPNGAAIAGAQIGVTQVNTGVHRETTTNDEGLYLGTGLPPGEYTMKVQAKGFTAKTSESPISLQVGQTTTVDTTLKIGDVTEVVDLVSEVPLIDTLDSKVDGFIDQRVIGSLPLNGRNFLELALLIPGNTLARHCRWCRQ